MKQRPWLDYYPKSVQWDKEYTPKPLFSITDESCSRYPSRNAADFLGKKYTYAELGDLIDRAAKGFQSLGVGKGVHVGLFLPNCPQFIVCYFGILKAGGTVVNFSPLYSEQELLQQVEDSCTDFMVTLNLKSLYPAIHRVQQKSRIKKLIVGTLDEVLPFPTNWLFKLFKRGEIASVDQNERYISYQEILDNDGTVVVPDIDPVNDIAVLQYTGGTTGVPKGAMLTHANLYINAQQSADLNTIATETGERMLGVLPFFHVFAMTGVMNQGLLMGAEILMLPRFELDAAMKLISKKKATIMFGVPTMYTAILHHKDASKETLGSIRACVSGGAPLPVELKNKFENLTGCKLVEGYGLTESSPVAAINPFEGANKPASIGLPAPGTDIIIIDPEDHSKILPQGEKGEICLRGPQIMKGYWRRPEATQDVMIGDMLRTGDIGYMDEEGYTFIVDRAKDLILVSGFNVFPRVVEEAIHQHEAVKEVTVIGVPDEYKGEIPKAFVVLKPGHENVTDKDILAFLRERIGRHEIPGQVEFRDELPKTMIGKLSKKELVAEEKAKREADGAVEG